MKHADELKPMGMADFGKELASLPTTDQARFLMSYIYETWSFQVEEIVTEIKATRDRDFAGANDTVEALRDFATHILEELE